MILPKIQRLFKLMIASGLGLLNLSILLLITKKTEQAIFCQNILQSIPDSFTQPIKLNLSAVFEVPINLVLGTLENLVNFFLWLIYGIGANYLDIPSLHIKEAAINTGITPIGIIPYLRNPENILNLCNYSNVATGIILSVGATALISTLTVAIMFSNIPKRWSSFINERRAESVSRDIEKLATKLQQIEIADLDYAMQRRLYPIRNLITSNRKNEHIN